MLSYDNDDYYRYLQILHTIERRVGLQTVGPKYYERILIIIISNNNNDS